MYDRPQSAADMAKAEMKIREAMAYSTPVARLDAVMNLYWHTPEDKRDAFVAVLVARLTLVRPDTSSSRLPAVVSPAGA